MHRGQGPGLSQAFSQESLIGSLFCSASISLFRAVSSALRDDVTSLIVGSFVYLILLVMGGFILPRCEFTRKCWHHCLRCPAA